MGDYTHRAAKIMDQLNELANSTEITGMITRTYGSAAFVEAGKKLALWMRAAGLQVAADNVGNIRGTLRALQPGAKTLIIASHFDSVVNAGKFDGPLGIVMGLDIIQQLLQHTAVQPFNIELVAFCDEEGVRYHTTYLGSKAIAGSFDLHWLDKKDKDGIALSTVIEQLGGKPDLILNDAMAAADLLGYFEIHIEQGPVLYTSGIPVAMVTAIAGQQRAELIFTGVAGHAGTVPMNMRHDALCCAAECIVAVENFARSHPPGLVATVGKLAIANAASNVVPGQVNCTLDIRSADESVLSAACAALETILQSICVERKIDFTWKKVQSTGPVACDPTLNQLLATSIEQAGHKLVQLVSGAGHDAVSMSAVCPVTMLFVRCFEGISHNPLEDVEIKDIAAAVEVADNFMLNLTATFNNS